MRGLGPLWRYAEAAEPPAPFDDGIGSSLRSVRAPSSIFELSTGSMKFRASNGAFPGAAWTFDRSIRAAVLMLVRRVVHGTSVMDGRYFGVVATGGSLPASSTSSTNCRAIIPTEYAL